MIYLDANVIIRLLEGDSQSRATVESRLASTRGGSAVWATSRLTRLECLCKPLAADDRGLLDLYEQFLAGTEIVLLEIDAAVVEIGTRLRAKFNFKTPDTLHLASAINSNTSAFITFDRALAKCTEIAVYVL